MLSPFYELTFSCQRPPLASLHCNIQSWQQHPPGECWGPAVQQSRTPPPVGQLGQLSSCRSKDVIIIMDYCNMRCFLFPSFLAFILSVTEFNTTAFILNNQTFLFWSRIVIIFMKSYIYSALSFSVGCLTWANTTEISGVVMSPSICFFLQHGGQLSADGATFCDNGGHEVRESRLG